MLSENEEEWIDEESDKLSNTSRMPSETGSVVLHNSCESNQFKHDGKIKDLFSKSSLESLFTPLSINEKSLAPNISAPASPFSREGRNEISVIDRQDLQYFSQPAVEKINENRVFPSASEKDSLFENKKTGIFSIFKTENNADVKENIFGSEKNLTEKQLFESNFYDTHTRRRLSELMNDISHVDYVPNLNGAKRTKLSVEEESSDIFLDHMKYINNKTSPENADADELFNASINDYPKDIDFLEVYSDTANSKKDDLFGDENIFEETDKNATNRTKKMVTIRNLNASSAFLAQLGQNHNMSFNAEEQRWDGNDEEMLPDEIICEEDMRKSLTDYHNISGDSENPYMKRNLQHGSSVEAEGKSKSDLESKSKIELESFKIFGNNDSNFASKTEISVVPQQKSQCNKSTNQTESHEEKSESNFFNEGIGAINDSNPDLESKSVIKPNLNANESYHEFNSAAFQDLDSKFRSLANIVAENENTFDSKFFEANETTNDHGPDSKRNSLIHGMNSPIASFLGDTVKRSSGSIFASNIAENVAPADPRDSIICSLVKALNLEQEWKLMTFLDLSNQNLSTVKGLNENLPNLRKLNLDYNKLTFLKGIPSSVLILSLVGNKLSNLTSFNMVQNLHFLDVSKNEISNISAFSCLNHVRELHLAYNLIVDLSPIFTTADECGLDCLQVLNVKGNRISKLNFTVSSLMFLTLLDVSSNALRSLYTLDSLKSIQEVNADCNNISALDFSIDVPTLQVLNLNDNKLSYFSGNYFSSLRYLSLNNNNLFSIEHPHLMRRLEFLSVKKQMNFDCNICDFTLFTNLTDLKLEGNNISLNSNNLKLPKLECLDLKDCRLSNLNILISNLSNLMFLTDLNIAMNKLSDKDLDLNLFMNLSNLRNLIMHHNNIKNFGHLLKILKSLKFLEVLDLRFNPLTKFFYKEHGHLNEKNDEISASVSSKKFTTSDGCFSEEFLDADHITAMSDSTFVRRLCYRSSVIHHCLKLRILDLINISQKDRKLSLLHVDKLKKVLKNSALAKRNHKKNEIKYNTSADNSVSNVKRNPTKDLNDYNENESSLFKNWEPVNYPLEEKNPSNIKEEVYLRISNN
ncbi:hypothetical protein HDU92_004195 [Lobulomyces angularis]|nr:hypothetical protein HDU92_004195 [Lobulomyces angularis]